MITSPLNAHPLPGTSRFLTSAESEPPPYTDEQAPPPYPPCDPKTVTIPSSTRSIPFTSSVTTEWSYKNSRSPDDTIITTVRINQLSLGVSFDDNLPERPPQRGFLRRLRSRVSGTNEDWKNLRAVRMPQREYMRHHRRDVHGNYAGTEPEQDWDDAKLGSCYGRYQRSPLVPNGLYHNAARGLCGW